MVNKIISLLGVVGLLSTLIVPTAFAADDDLTLSASTLNIVEAGTSAVTVDVTKLTGEELTTLYVETSTGGNIADLTAVAGFTCDLAATDCTVEWDGTDDATGAFVDEGAYKVYLGVDSVESDVEDLAVTKDLWIESFDVPEMTWDPNAVELSLDGHYVLSKDVTVITKVKDANDDLVDTFTGDTWNGQNSDDEYVLFDGFDYTLELNAGTDTATDTISINYMDDLAPVIENYEPITGSSDASFEADEEEVTVSFDINHSAKVTVNVVNAGGTIVYSPADYDGEEEWDEVSFDWNGAEPIPVETGLYTVEVTLVNESGAVFDDSLVLDVDAENITDYNDTTSKIKYIDLDPSGDWDPLEDEMTIRWETTVDFDSFTIEAWKGSEKIELFDESDLEEDDNHKFDFVGLDDDGEYLESGDWTLYFIGEIDDVTYYNTKDFTVDYDKPSIDKTYLTKDEIDPEVGEGVYLLFMMEDDAEIRVEIYENGKSEVELITEDDDQEVEKDKWYAVYWDGLDEDGDELDEDDSFKFVLTACSLGSDDDADCDEDSEKIDLDEDTASSSKSNITQDITIPAIIEQGDDLELTFNIEDDADVSVGIWKGTSTSGNADVVLLDEVALSAGDYKFVWDGRDEDGDKVKDDEYTYKITTKKSGSSSEETEKGTFRVGDLGEVLSGPSSVSIDDDDDDDDTDLSDNPYLVIDDDDDVTGSSEFPDVLPTNKNYKAIVWAAEQEIFEGNDDGTFLPYDEINRAEVLAVVLRAFDLPFYAADGSNLGWTDVNTSAWYMGFLKSGKMAGLLEGDAGSTTVRPGDGVGRVELLKFIYEAAKLKGVSSVGACAFNPYADVTTGHWYTDYVCQAKTDGLFDTVGGVFFPSVEASRGEVAEALYRLLK
jgi:hypothetical protein